MEAQSMAQSSRFVGHLSHAFQPAGAFGRPHDTATRMADRRPEAQGAQVLYDTELMQHTLAWFTSEL